MCVGIPAFWARNQSVGPGLVADGACDPGIDVSPLNVMDNGLHIGAISRKQDGS